jgi:hypothetical protein
MEGSGVKDVIQCNTALDCRGGAHWYCPTVQKFSFVLVFAVATGSSCSLHIDLGCMFLRHPVSMPRRESPKRIHFARVCKSTYLPKDEEGKEIGSLLRGKVQPSSVNLCKMDLWPPKIHVTEIFQQTAYLLLLAPPSTPVYKFQIAFQPISAFDSLAESCLRGTPMITR